MRKKIFSNNNQSNAHRRHENFNILLNLSISYDKKLFEKFSKSLRNFDIRTIKNKCCLNRIIFDPTHTIQHYNLHISSRGIIKKF